MTVPTTLVQYTLTVQDYKPQERNNQSGPGNSIIKGKISGHMGDPEIALVECCASQLVVSLMTMRATARESVCRDSSLVVGPRLKSGLGAVKGSGRHLVRCGLA